MFELPAYNLAAFVLLHELQAKIRLIENMFKCVNCTQLSTTSFIVFVRTITLMHYGVRRCSHIGLVLFTFSYLLALRQSIQHTTESTINNRHAVETDQKAICRGCFGSHQYYNNNRTFIIKYSTDLYVKKMINIWSLLQ